MFITSDISVLVLFIPQLDEIYRIPTTLNLLDGRPSASSCGTLPRVWSLMIPVYPATGVPPANLP